MGLAFLLPLARCSWDFPSWPSAVVNRAEFWSGEAGEGGTFISQEPAMVFDGFPCARNGVSLFTSLKQCPPDVP